MFEHLRGIARRVTDCSGDVRCIRAAIDDFSALDAATRAVEGRYVRCEDPKGEWVMARNSDPARRLLYLHGGSWMSGSPYGYRPLAARVAGATGCSVLVLDYRLAPENPFPAGLDDCVRAYLWLRDNGPAGAAAARSLVLAGDSAGGNLALASALRLRDEGVEPPAALVALSPAVDLTWQGATLETHAALDPILRPDRLGLVSRAYVQGAERMDHPYVSPLYGDFRGLGRLLIQVGDHEVLLDDAKRLRDRAFEGGVDVELQIFPGMPHVFQMFAPTVVSAGEALQRIGRFVTASMS